MSRNMLILVLLVVTTASPVAAVDTLNVASPDPILEKWRWTEFERSSGLAGAVRDIFEDRDGNIWFATAQGVQRYDGYRWTRYTTEDGLADNRVTTVIQARDGAMWFGTYGGGISRFDGRRWRTYTARDGLPEGVGFVSLWQTADGTIWAGGEGGRLCRFDGERWESYAPEAVPQLGAMILLGRPTRGGVVWFLGWRTDQVFRFDPKEAWTVYTHPDGLSGGFEDTDGSVWFHTRRSAVRYRGGLWTAYTPADGFLDGEVVRMRRTSDGTLWFIGVRQGASVVARYDRTGWRTYTAGDGLVDMVHRQTQYTVRNPEILEARDGSVWFMGQHNGKAAVSRFDPHRLADARSGQASAGSGQAAWTRYSEADGLVGELIRLGYEATDGTLWFGSYIPYSVSGDGLFRFDPSAGSGQAAWTHYTEADGLSSSRIHGITEWPDGTLWVGTMAGISRLDLSAAVYEPNWWNKVDFHVGDPKVTGFLPTGDALWFRFLPGRRAGVVRYDGETWRIYTDADGLAANGVSSIIQASDGALWFAAQGGVSRFDGEQWARYTEENGPPLRGAAPKIREMHDGSFWIDGSDGTVVHFRYGSEQAMPETVLEPAADQVSSAGNILLRWTGRDLWNDTPPRDMRYQWRMDGGAWSPWSERTDFTFTQLPSGRHVFEIQSLDRDGNVDPTPAVHAFVVEAPWWRNPWVVGLFIALVGITGFQASRLVIGNRKLQEANRALSSANRELFGLNRELQQKTEDLERDRAVAHIRAHVQSMEQASDFERVLSLVSEDLKVVGLSFDACSIDVLSEPVDDPSMAYFEEVGFRYTAYTIDPEGSVSRESYHTPGPFPPVVRETVERFIAGQPWRGRSEQNTIVEVPISGYGRLRLSASDRDRFTEEDIASLRDFASAIALGYARYLDIREIQEQTQRKSAFLASMSHELRTPITAIKGFTSLVLRRIGESIPERHRGNLNTVMQASDHLLAMINDLLDLSKIEAGRMDVNAGPFDVKALVASCCATVSPLVAEKPDVKSDYDVPDDIGEANTDQARMRQMVINLLSNAIKFTDSGRVTVRAGREDGRLAIAVADTGKGIPADEIDTIFDEYRQVKGADREHKGTGLGLSITRKFAELLGGTISVESEVGKGSTLTVRVPAVYGES